MPMPLSKHYIDDHEGNVPVDEAGLREFLVRDYPQIVFAYVMGSAKDGVIGPHGDLDLAVYCSAKLTLERRCSLVEAVEAMHRGIRCDLGTLNGAEPVYCYEALRGKLLFVRERERWLQFYSRTCRQYESQMFHYRKQLTYRRANGCR